MAIWRQPPVPCRWPADPPGRRRGRCLTIRPSSYIDALNKNRRQAHLSEQRQVRNARVATRYVRAQRRQPRRLRMSRNCAP